VLLVKPRPPVPNIRGDRLLRCEPLALEYLATVLASHDVTILDGVMDGRDPVRLARRLQPEAVLFTAVITDITSVVHYATALKRLPCPPLVFVGGVHAEVCPQHFDDAAIDGVFFARQLTGITDVLAAVADGRPYQETPGAAFRRHGVLVTNPAPSGGQHMLPHLQRQCFTRRPDAYRYLHYRRCALVKTSFGCPGQCTFCFCARMNGGCYTARDLDDVVDEIAGLRDAETVFLVDDNFLVDPARLEAFCAKIAARGIRKQFIAYGTAHFIAHHPALLQRLREVGLHGLIVGFEFVTDTALAEVGKSSTRAENDATVALCREMDIDLMALFIIDPAWRDAEFRRLAAYLREQQLPFATFATLTPFPGTALDDGRTQRTAPREIAWWRYDLLRLHGPSALPRWRYYLWLYALYLQPSLATGILRNVLRRCGPWETLRLVAMSLVTGLEYLLKLLIWR
jgi:radical SAM superfamily enzyme YgiQ (UPF0313 family)